MKKVFIFLLCIGMLIGAGNALATPVVFDVDDKDQSGNYESFVTLSDIQTGFWGFGTNTAISASLADLDSIDNFTLGDFESTTFDFFTFSVTGSGIGSFSLNSNLHFEAPNIDATGAGNGGWGTINLGFLGTLSGGLFSWQNSSEQTFDLADGNSVSIALDEGFAIVAGSQVTVQATVTNLGGGTAAAPVPEPATILLSGLGLLSMGTYLRKRKAKKA